MKQYLEALEKILVNGKDKVDRTGVGTKSMFGVHMRFDLQQGFPAVTTKKLAWKSVVSELLWFLEGSGDERRLAEILHGTRDPEKKTIWTANATADYWSPKATYPGDLGVVYGNMWRKWPADPAKIVDIVRRRKEPDAPISYNPVLEPYESSDDLTGVILENSSGHKFRVLKNVGVINGNSHYRIQFLRTGFIDIVPRPTILNKGHRDWFEPFQNGVGVYGRKKKNNSSKIDRRIYNLWNNMISRCYDKNHPQYKFYGSLGVTVSTEWQDFSKFEHSIKSVPGFYNWCSDVKYELNKDYYGANQYSASTTIFIHKKYNQELSRKKFKETPEILERRQFFVDQVANLIEGIKKDPSGRRHIISAWNPPELPNMALPPCHVMSQFDVTDGKLSCQLYQRSADMGLGIPFNIASYALFTHMIAQICSLDVGELVITLGDAHIYKNHVDAVREQLARTPTELPTLVMPKFSTLDELLKTSIDQYTLANYHPRDSIKMSMAV